MRSSFGGKVGLLIRPVVGPRTSDLRDGEAIPSTVLVIHFLRMCLDEDGLWDCRWVNMMCDTTVYSVLFRGPKNRILTNLNHGTQFRRLIQIQCHAIAQDVSSDKLLIKHTSKLRNLTGVLDPSQICNARCLDYLGILSFPFLTSSSSNASLYTLTIYTAHLVASEDATDLH